MVNSVWVMILKDVFLHIQVITSAL